MKEPDALEGAESEELLGIAEASRRVGVHPNTVRRFIHRGLLSATLVKGPHGETWLVDLVELERLAGTPRPRGPQPGSRAARRQSARDLILASDLPAAHAADGGVSPDAGPATLEQPMDVAAAGSSAASADEPPAALVSAALASRPVTPASGGPVPPAGLPGDLGMTQERAVALEHYSRGMMEPFIDLLRERDAALERREALIRHQVERIGRLEREIELLRAQLARAGRELRANPVLEAEAREMGSSSVGARARLAAQVSDSDEMVALATHVERLRGDLRMMVTRLEAATDLIPSRVGGAPATTGPTEISTLSSTAVPSGTPDNPASPAALDRPEGAEENVRAAGGGVLPDAQADSPSSLADVDKAGWAAASEHENLAAGAAAAAASMISAASTPPGQPALARAAGVAAADAPSVSGAGSASGRPDNVHPSGGTVAASGSGDPFEEAEAAIRLFQHVLAAQRASAGQPGHRDERAVGGPPGGLIGPPSSRSGRPDATAGTTALGSPAHDAWIGAARAVEGAAADDARGEPGGPGRPASAPSVGSGGNSGGSTGNASATKPKRPWWRIW